MISLSLDYEKPGVSDNLCQRSSVRGRYLPAERIYGDLSNNTQNLKDI